MLPAAGCAIYLFIAIPTSQGMPTNMTDISHLLVIASTECVQYGFCRRILPSALGALVIIVQFGYIVFFNDPYNQVHQEKKLTCKIVEKIVLSKVINIRMLYFFNVSINFLFIICSAIWLIKNHGCDSGHCYLTVFRADLRFAPSQWEKALLCNDVSH